MNDTEQVTDVLVVGAGMAGLIAAAELRRAGRRVLVLDKGRGVGGRMASRRIEGATFDHGAQFITAHDPRFAALLERVRQEGAVVAWDRAFPGDPDGPRRWRGRPTMSAVAKHLSAGLDVRMETPVASLGRAGNGWRVEIANSPAITAEAVLLTPPVPQSLALLAAGDPVLAPDVRTRLAAIEYERCLAVLAVLEGPSRLPPPGALAPTDGPIAWLADNQQKGVSAEPSVTLHATPAFSLANWDRDRQESGRILLEAAAPRLGVGVRTFQVHGWRYSKPLRHAEEPGRCLRLAPGLVVAGDAFGGPSVEGAALSGWAAAAAILDGSDGGPGAP